MFAEELGVNASRKRAEANKARRLKHKQEQERKRTTPNSIGTPSTSVPVVDIPKPSVAPLSVVERATQEREKRASEASTRKLAVLLQSHARRRKIYRLAQAEQLESLQKRLSDLQTVRSIIRKQKNIDYVAPPATCIGLLRQLLFIHQSPREKILCSVDNGKLLRDTLVFVVLPGLQQDDPNMYPLLIDSPEARYRLKILLRLVTFSLFAKSVSVETLTVSIRFLRCLLADSALACHQEVANFARSLLFRDNSPGIAFQKKESPLIQLRTSPDLISIYRYYLLFEISNRPIPAEVTDLREKCFSNENRERSGQIFEFILQQCQSSSQQSLFFRDILTVPLLTWKISSQTVDRFVNSSEESSGPVFLDLVRAWVNEHGSEIARGRIEHVLGHEELSLHECPATASQCVLANSIRLGIVCRSVNAHDVSALKFTEGALFYDYLSLLLNHVPLPTLTSRDSAVEWVEGKDGQKTPIVISPVILEQCKALFVDSYIRRLLSCAIDNDYLRTDSILSEKNNKDLQYEKDIAEAGSTSASALAAKEARIDRSKKFWNASKWAKKLSKGVSSLVGGDDRKGGSNIDDANDKAIDEEPATKSVQYRDELLFAVVRLLAVVLGRWGGYGAPKQNTGSQHGRATSTPEQFTITLMNALCFSTSLLKTTWAMIQSDSKLVSNIYSIIDPNKGRLEVRNLRITPALTKPTMEGRSDSDGSAFLFMFTVTLAHTLIVIDDIELHDMDRPLPLHQLRRAIQVFKKLLHRASCIDDQLSSCTDYLGISLVSSSARAMRDLYDRSSRKPFCVPKFWVISDLMEDEMRKCKSFEQYVSLLSHPVFKLCPFLVSFKRRLKLFERIVTTNRIEIQGENSANPFHTNPLKPGIPVRITRGRILEDGLLTMNRLGRNMRKRIVVQYFNEAGMRESGVDVGGLFKEFWTDLCAIAFDPNYALFRVTEDSQACMYPNPSSASAHGVDHIVLFEFLGRILGKALYEGITIHPRFAHFFLSFLRGDYNYLHMLADLQSVDSQLYNNLMFLKNYDGDASDLALTFTVVADDFGGSKEIPLIPNGANVDVTNANKHRYIGLVAKYYVVDRLKEQAEAFTRGLWDVIDRGWLQLFNEPELQVLISGSSEDKIDVNDMRSNTRYVGGFTGIDRSVGRFWKVFESFNPTEQAELLRFVTGCERPPPLGFSSMNPPFTIQRVGILRDGDKLPAASTCFNTLKLPTYSSERVMRERLLFAIKSGAGFELT